MAKFYTTQSSDDAVQLADNSVSIIETGSVAGGKIDGTQHAGFRFPNVTVGQGIVISSAKLTFPQLNNFTGGAATLNHTELYGEAADNAAVFSTTASDITGRTRTTAKLAKSVMPATAEWSSAGVDITSIVQEILNRAGWASGNAMSLLFISDTTAGNLIQPYYWDYFTGLYAAELDITVNSVDRWAGQKPDKVFETKKQQHIYPSFFYNPLIIAERIDQIQVVADQTGIGRINRMSGY